MSKDKVSTQELIKQLAKRLNINEKLAEDFLKAMFSTMEEELLRGEPVKVKNLGVFKLQWNEPRKSVDVTTGDEIMLEGYNKISFTPDSKLKDIVNVMKNISTINEYDKNILEEYSIYLNQFSKKYFNLNLFLFLYITSLF